MIGALKQVEAGRKVEDVARRGGRVQAHALPWKAKYGGMEVSQAAGSRKQLRTRTESCGKVGSGSESGQRSAAVVIRKTAGARSP